MQILTVAQALDIRDGFFNLTGIDLNKLDLDEVDLLLSLLPLVLAYIHDAYSTAGT